MKVPNNKNRPFKTNNRGEADVWDLIGIVFSAIIAVIVMSIVGKGKSNTYTELVGDAGVTDIVVTEAPKSPEVETESETITVKEPKEEKPEVVTTTARPTETPSPPVTTVPDVWLTDLDYIKKGSVEIRDKETGETNTGEKFEHYMFAHRPYSEVVYYLGGKYDKLTAIWTICNNNKNTVDNNSFEIYSDNLLVYSSNTITGGSLPEDISVDIKGCQVLTIMFKEGIGAGELGNIKLYGTSDQAASTPRPEILPTFLTDLDYLTECDVYIKDNDKCITNIGSTYNHALKGSAGAEITYYLNGQYSTISGIWAIKEQYKNTNHNCQFAIYADDALVYTSPSITAGSLPVDFAVDINRCQMLKIVFLDGHGEADAGNIRVYP